MGGGAGLECAPFFIPILLSCLVAAYAEPLDLVRLRFPDQSVYLWSADAALPFLQGIKFVGIILLIFFLTVAAFTALGEKVGELFDAFPPLTAYSINVVGSLLGILAFSGIAFAHWPPLLWIVAAAVLCLWFFPRPLPAAVLEYTSMAMGIRSLTVLALVLYGLSWLALLFRGWRLAWMRA